MSKQLLKEYLLNNGKDKTYRELSQLFGVTVNVAEHTYRDLKRNKKIQKIENKVVQNNYISSLEDTIVSIIEDISKGTAEKSTTTNEEIKSLEDLIRICKIDTSLWNIDKYICNKWGENFQVKAFLSKKTPKENTTQEFIKFLESYQPQSVQRVHRLKSPKAQGQLLILNKTDLHLDKFDELGNNDIQDRVEKVQSYIFDHVKKANINNNLEKVIYVVGSDEFNSEWTQTTTKGTPQKNTLTYQDGFKALCDLEISIIDHIINNTEADVHITYIPGNHDEYVGWHLIHFLQTYYRTEECVSFDINPSYTKYIRYGNSALQFNHGDAIKPEKLVNLFPIEFNKEWSNCDYYYSFIGDKHHNHYKNINGVEFYQLSAVSGARSKWDLKNGYITEGQLTSFVINKQEGLTDMYRSNIRYNLI